MFEEAKKLFAPYFDGYIINAHTSAYNEPKSDIITAEYLQKELQKRKIKLKDISDETGIDVSNLSAWVKDIRPMSNIVKNFYKNIQNFIQWKNKQYQV